MNRLSDDKTAPSYSLLRMEEHPEVGGDTAWVSGYGLYDELSPHMQKLLEGLHAVHTSRLQYETTIVSTNIHSSFCSCLKLPTFPPHCQPSCILGANGHTLYIQHGQGGRIGTNKISSLRTTSAMSPVARRSTPTTLRFAHTLLLA